MHYPGLNERGICEGIIIAFIAILIILCSSLAYHPTTKHECGRKAPTIGICAETEAMMDGKGDVACSSAILCYCGGKTCAVSTNVPRVWTAVGKEDGKEALDRRDMWMGQLQGFPVTC